MINQTTLTTDKYTAVIPTELLQNVVLTMYNKTYPTFDKFLQEYTNKDVTHILFFLFNRGLLDEVKIYERKENI